MGLRTGLSAPARRLPDRLDDLHGPWQGTVVLPVHLSWHQFREFDVARQKPRLLLYSIVISQGRRNDVARFLNAERLREDWPELRLLVSSRMRRACERKLGLPRNPPRAATPRRICQADDMRKYVIMGVQGSRKGTQSQMLAADLDLVHIGVGDIFRWNVQNHTKMGAQVRRTMAVGELVGDDLVESVVRDRLTEHDWNFGFIIDGFPRNRRQAEFFLESYDIDGVIVLDLPDSEVRRRVLNRRLCADCGMDYHLIDSSPKVSGRCDSCGGDLVIREDDTEEALAVRLRDYHEKTNPVIELFRRKEYVFTVDARSAPEAVQEQIRKCLGLPPQTVRKSREPGAAGA